MQEQLVTFEAAKLAKEKNCKIETEIGYDLSGYLIKKRSLLFINAPTQSLLAKWLRENYNLHVVINVGLPHNSSIMYYCNVVKFGKHHKSKFKSIFYKTYEEAYEIGLQEALKLI